MGESFHIVEVGHDQCFASSFNAKKIYGWRSVDAAYGTDSAALVELMLSHGVDATTWAPGRMAELVDEICQSKYADLMVSAEGVMERVINVIKVRFYAEIHGVDHIAQSWNSSDSKPKLVTMRMQQIWHWEDAVGYVLHEKLDLDNDFIDEHLIVEEDTYRLFDELETSKTFPGLTTRYLIHEVRVRLVDSHRQGMRRLGLPDGTDFHIQKTNNSKDSVRWSWVIAAEHVQPLLRSNTMKIANLAKSASCLDGTVDVVALKKKRQLTIPQVQEFTTEQYKDIGGPCPLLALLLQGRKPSVDRARNAAKRIRDKNYTCRQFYEDCAAAFPELSAYVCGSATTSSGLSSSDEYQRTLGALFAVYWLMRLHLDGANSFTYGVDKAWNALDENQALPYRSPEETEKRSDFKKNIDWQKCEQLFIDAGILLISPDSGAISHDVERTLAMLVLTAIHDIMKVEALLPIVQTSHDNWMGYRAGDKIHDHDTALAYVLSFYGDLLPSFAMLPRMQKKSIVFSQCKLDYNMGWLVQAEAPPGALFSTFKKIIREDGASTQDVAFYFVHWLTDLAGAEPYPREGCEKFVLKFPEKALNAFLGSFSLVHNLSHKSEVEVYEDYVTWRWDTYEAAVLGPPPTGPGSIAIMRLVIMAQGYSANVVDAFYQLDTADRHVLEEELARSGCKDTYTSDHCTHPERGPAFLVYYAPALMQKNNSGDLRLTMRILADVFRQARNIFPLVDERLMDTVTVRIDQLKGLVASAIMTPQDLGDVWVLSKTNAKEAEVRKDNLMTGFDFDEDYERILFSSAATSRKTFVAVKKGNSSKSGRKKCNPLTVSFAAARLKKGTSVRQSESEEVSKKISVRTVKVECAKPPEAAPRMTDAASRKIKRYQALTKVAQDEPVDAEPVGLSVLCSFGSN